MRTNSPPPTTEKTRPVTASVEPAEHGPTRSKATGVAFDTVSPVHRATFTSHPLGKPNTNNACFQVQTNKGRAYFAIGCYSQHCDPNIITITRMLYPDQSASHFLAVFRKYLRHKTSYRAVATWTDEAHQGTHLQADGWVYVTNTRNRKRWLRTL